MTNFLKLLVDHYPEIKLLVSGSSSFNIRDKFRDSLAGRKFLYNIHPLNFCEYLCFRGRNNLAEIQGDWEKARFFMEDFSRYFRDYMVFGGLPKVALLSTDEEKTEYLKDVVDSYIRKDIKDLFRIDNPYAFNNLLKLLAVSMGKLMNISQVAGIVGLSRQTTERYMFILESTFVIRLIRPFYRNRKKEISKLQKLYFIDTGIRNIIVGSMNS